MKSVNKTSCYQEKRANNTLLLLYASGKKYIKMNLINYSLSVYVPNYFRKVLITLLTQNYE